MAVSKELLRQGHQVYVLNRGSRAAELPDAVFLQADISEEERVAELLKPYTFDVVAEFIAFVPEQVERDYRLFAGKTKQYIFISSATVYEKPPHSYVITEETPLGNPYWTYAQNKIACEQVLMGYYEREKFPVTIVRPSHTYDERDIPVGIHGDKGSYSVIRRMLQGKPILVHGDGQSLWTMTHQSDFARGFAGLVGKQEAIGEAYQITSDESFTWNQIYEMLAELLGVPFIPMYVPSAFLAEYSPYDMQGNLLGDKANTMVFDNGKIKKLVPDFHTEKPLKQGLAECIAYVNAHPERQREDPEFDKWCDCVIEAWQQAAQWMEKEEV